MKFALAEDDNDFPRINSVILKVERACAGEPLEDATIALAIILAQLIAHVARSRDDALVGIDKVTSDMRQQIMDNMPAGGVQ